VTSLEIPAAIVSPRVRLIHAYWESKRAGRWAPRRADIDPGEMKSLLPYVLIGEVLRSPFDVRYRLAGTAVVDAYGHDFTGRKLSAMPVTTGLEKWLAHYKRLVDEKRPQFGRYRGMIGSDFLRLVDSATLPLSMGGSDVEQFLALEDWSEIRGINPASVAHSTWNFEPL
jgi:hypothetical protein